jgi:hypothetical protein
MLSEIFGLLAVLKKLGVYDFLGETHMMVAFPVVLLVLCSLYVLESWGLMRLARQRGAQNSWLAWIPFCRSYLLGRVGRNQPTGYLLFLFDVLTFTELIAAPFGFSLFIAAKCVVLHSFYRLMSDKARMMTVVSIFTCGLSASWFLFVLARDVRSGRDVTIDTSINNVVDKELHSIPSNVAHLDLNEGRVDGSLSVATSVPLSTALEERSEGIERATPAQGAGSFDATEQGNVSVHEQVVTPLEEIAESEIVALAQSFPSFDAGEEADALALTPLDEITTTDMLQIAELYTGDADMKEDVQAIDGMLVGRAAPSIATSDVRVAAAGDCVGQRVDDDMLEVATKVVSFPRFESNNAWGSAPEWGGPGEYLNFTHPLELNYTPEMLAQFAEFKKFKELKACKEFKAYKEFKAFKEFEEFERFMQQKRAGKLAKPGQVEKVPH